MFTAPSGSQSNPARGRSTARPLSRERVFCLPWVSRRVVTPASPLLVALMALLTFASPGAAFQEAPEAKEAVTKSTSWLLSQQADDGGFVGFSGESDPSITSDAIIALAAARAAGIEVDLDSAFAFLTSGDVALVYAQTGAGQAAKLVLAAAAAGADPRNVNGVDPLSLAVAGLDETTGLYGTGVYDHSLVMLAIAAAGDDIPDAAAETLIDYQIDDGSWAFDGSDIRGAGDTNTTAAAIMALVAAGATGAPEIDNALSYLESAQVEGGGFPYQPGDGAVADANSTGIVIQALIAAGEDPSSESWSNATAALLTFQNESGSFSYMAEPADDNLYATVQAIPAAAGVTLPVVADESEQVASPIAA